jgi:hypothetical protein
MSLDNNSSCFLFLLFDTKTHSDRENDKLSDYEEIDWTVKVIMLIN